MVPKMKAQFYFAVATNDDARQAEVAKVIKETPDFVAAFRAAVKVIAERARLDFCLAELFAQAGMQDRAIEFLRKAINEGFNDSKRLMQDPVFANLRKTAEFAQLMSAEKMP